MRLVHSQKTMKFYFFFYSSIFFVVEIFIYKTVEKIEFVAYLLHTSKFCLPAHAAMIF